MGPREGREGETLADREMGVGELDEEITEAEDETGWIDEAGTMAEEETDGADGLGRAEAAPDMIERTEKKTKMCVREEQERERRCVVDEG